MTEVVKIYNPANASALTAEQIEGLQNLTIEEIGQLAKAYPNASYPAAYLLIIDKSKPVEKQIPSLSSFPNLYNLITRNGLKNYAALNFKGNYKPVLRAPVATSKTRKTEVRDLSEVELMSLPGFKAGNELIPAESIPVVKVKRGRKPKQVEKPE